MIREKAFYGCKNLKRIVLPENLSYLGSSAFCGCENLKTATVKGKLDDYRADCVFPFQNCSSLETLTFLDCVRYIKEESCNGCKSLKNIFVPAKKGDYYKKRFVEELHPLIVELEAKKKK